MNPTRPTNAINPLENLRIASPCSADWDAMDGDAKRRFCGDCKLHVHDISSMTSDEAVDFLKAQSGRTCVRFYQRADGRVLTQDCPVGWAKLRATAQATRRRAVVLATSLFGAMAFGLSACGLRTAADQAATPDPVTEPITPEPVDCEPLMGAMPFPEPPVEEPIHELMGEVEMIPDPVNANPEKVDGPPRQLMGRMTTPPEQPQSEPGDK